VVGTHLLGLGNHVDDSVGLVLGLNVLGVWWITKALLPQLRASGDGHAIVVSSAAGVEAYKGARATTRPSSERTP
jgi:NADP-dependent 3-hydroxy acid dehydrogenase YdfG